MRADLIAPGTRWIPRRASGVGARIAASAASIDVSPASSRSRIAKADVVSRSPARTQQRPHQERCELLAAATDRHRRAVRNDERVGGSRIELRRVELLRPRAALEHDGLQPSDEAVDRLGRDEDRRIGRQPLHAAILVPRVGMLLVGNVTVAPPPLHVIFDLYSLSSSGSKVTA